MRIYNEVTKKYYDSELESLNATEEYLNIERRKLNKKREDFEKRQSQLNDKHDKKVLSKKIEDAIQHIKDCQKEQKDIYDKAVKKMEETYNEVSAQLEEASKKTTHAHKEYGDVLQEFTSKYGPYQFEIDPKDFVEIDPLFSIELHYLL